MVLNIEFNKTIFIWILYNISRDLRICLTQKRDDWVPVVICVGNNKTHYNITRPRRKDLWDCQYDEKRERHSTGRHGDGQRSCEGRGSRDRRRSRQKLSSTGPLGLLYRLIFTRFTFSLTGTPSQTPEETLKDTPREETQSTAFAITYLPSGQKGNEEL